MKNLFLLLFFLQLTSVAAQITAPVIKYINTDVGLKSLSVNNCVIDNNGFVWIATEMGLYRYNWNKAHLVEHSTFTKIKQQRITNLYKDEKTGIIYFITNTEGKKYSIENNYIRQLEDQSGTFIKSDCFMLATHPMFDAIAKYKDTKKEYHKTHFRNPEDAILTNSSYYIRTDETIDVLDKSGSFTAIPFPSAREEAVLMKIQDAVFVLSKGGVNRFNGAQLTDEKITADDIMVDFLNTTVDLFKMNKVFVVNNINYINHKNKLYEIQYNAKKKQLYATFLIDFPPPYNTEFTYSEEHDLYLFNSKTDGIVLIQPNAFNNIPTKEHKNNYSDYSIVEKNEQWYNFNGWVYDTNQKTLQKRFINNYRGNMRFLLEYKGNFFYEAQNNELISLIDLKTKAPFKLENKILGLTGFTYIDTTLWLSNQKNCAYLQHNKFVFDTIVNKALRPNQDINAISAKGDKLIFATSKGVFLHKPFSDDIKYIKGLENVNARYIKHIDKSSFWVGCYGEGLFLVRNNIAYQVVDANLNIGTAHAIEEDQSGTLWISTNNGLLTVNKQKAITNTLQRKPIKCYLYTVKDGLPTDEFNGGSTFPSLKTADGIIGFPSMKGFVYFHPKNMRKRPFSSNIILDEVLVDTKIILPSKTGSYMMDSNVEVMSLNMDYAYSGNRENLSLFYKFENQTQWNSLKSRTIVIPRYKKGAQKLQIKIHTHGFDAKDDVIKSFTFNFEPRFYETVAFWILVLIGTILVLAFSYFIGRRFNKIKERELNEKIALKTQQLQDSILELTISKEKIRESLTEKEVLLREIHHRVKNNLQLILSMLNIQARRGNYADIFDFLKKGESRINAMALIHSRLYLSDQVFDKMNMQKYLEDLTSSISKTHENTDEKVRIKVAAAALHINLTTSIPLGLMINELLSNALKHGFPDTKKGDVTIMITKKGNHQFELIFEDNGVGFDAEVKRTSSFGLELINLLASQLSGSVKMDTVNSTKFIINFKEIIHN